MALDIKYTPGTRFSAHGDLLFTVLESTKAADPVTYPDYRYVCDVYIGATMVARLKAVPQPISLLGIFNVSNIIRSYFETKLNPTASSFIAQQLGSLDFYVNATMKFGEEYDFVLYTNVTVDSERTYFNHYNGRMIGVNTALDAKVGLIASDFETYPGTTFPGTNSINKFISVRRDSQYHFVPYMPKSASGLDNYLTFGGVGTGLSTSTQIVPANANTMQILNFAPVALNALAPGYVNDSTSLLYIGVQDLLGGPVRQYFYVKFICEPRYQVYTIHFLNKYGGFESRNFTKVSRKSIKLERSEFGKIPYTFDASGAPSYYNSNKVYNETRSVYATTYEERMTLNTDFLTDAEYRWLGQLIASPMVFIEMEGYFVPCVITDSDYEYRTSVVDKLTSLTMNIEFGDIFNSQFR